MANEQIKQYVQSVPVENFLRPTDPGEFMAIGRDFLDQLDKIGQYDPNETDVERNQKETVRKVMLAVAMLP